MMFCSQFDRFADAAARGGPREARALDAHVATCAACTAEAVLADDAFDLADTLAPLRDAACPPAIVTAALREARTAARPAVRPPRSFARLRLAGVAFAVTLVAGLALRMGVTDPAEVALAPTDAPPLEVASADTGEPSMSLSTPTPKPSPARDAVADKTEEASTALPSVSDTRDDPAPRLRPTLASATPPPADPAPTASDTLAAVDGLRLALTVLRDARREGLAAAAPELGRPLVTLATSIPDSP